MPIQFVSKCTTSISPRHLGNCQRNHQTARGHSLDGKSASTMMHRVYLPALNPNGTWLRTRLAAGWIKHQRTPHVRERGSTSDGCDFVHRPRAPCSENQI